jgi:hypothetical protein
LFHSIAWLAFKENVSSILVPKKTHILELCLKLFGGALLIHFLAFLVNSRKFCAGFA